jgi:hypothetical protein
MLEKNIGPPTEAMPNHGGSFNMDIFFKGNAVREAPTAIFF